MLNDKKILAVIIARGGSKGLPGKNIKEFKGKPLIAWTIDAAKASQYIDKTILSTDCPEIQAVAKEHGCEVPFTRPDELSGDSITALDVVLHALDAIEEKFDYVVLLQPTSPLRVTEDIDGAISECFNREAHTCVSITEEEKPPHWVYTYNSSSASISPILEKESTVLRRQDCTETYSRLNGAVYVASVEWLKAGNNFIENNTVGYMMPKERSIDIDTQLDFDLAKFYHDIS